MMWSCLLLQSLLLAVITAQVQQLPSSFPRCHRGDLELDQCLVKAIQAVLPQLAKGVPELNFPPLDPWDAGVVEIRRPEGSNSLGIRLSNITVHGLSSARILDVKSDLDNSRLSLFAEFPNVWTEASYELDAILEGQPLVSQGRVKIYFSKPQASLTPTGTTQLRDLGRFFLVDVTAVNIETLSEVTFNFDGLDPDPARNALINQKFNDHAQELFDGILPQWTEQWGSQINKLTKPIFERVPKDQIFLED